MDINKEVKQLTQTQNDIHYIAAQAKKVDSLLKIVIDLQKRVMVLEKSIKTGNVKDAAKSKSAAKKSVKKESNVPGKRSIPRTTK